MAGTADELSSSATSPRLLSFKSLSPTTATAPYAPFLRDLKSDDRGLFLIRLLLNCAAHVASGNLPQANTFLEHISFLSSSDGDTMQRIASYFTEALAGRLLRSWPGLYRALNPILPDSAAASIHGRRLFLELFPFLRLSYLISNQAILEAMEGEKVIHVIDLGGSDPSHWLAFLQAVSVRPEGPPHLRITAVAENRDFLTQTALILSEEAEKLDIPFQFHAVVSQLDALNIESLRVKTGEALAITSVLKLHTLLASDEAAASPGKPFSSPAKIESFLASLWGFSPKLMVVTEQESNHNGADLNERFMEALNFYAALFDCLEWTVPRQSAERSRVEKLVFGEEIKNIIACEGLERKERHEKLGKWIQRFEMAGFGRVSLSYYGLVQARRMLQGFGCDGYKVKEENGCFLFCWQERAMFSISAWRFRRTFLCSHPSSPSIHKYQSSLSIHHTNEIFIANITISVGIHAADHPPAIVDSTTAVSDGEEDAEKFFFRDLTISIGIKDGESVAELAASDWCDQGFRSDGPEFLEADAAIAVEIDFGNHGGEFIVGWWIGG